MRRKTVRTGAKARPSELITYRLADGVQVRREKFGLLFYNYRGPRIYFVPSKSLIGDEFFDGTQTMRDLVDSVQQKHGLPRQKVRDHLESVLRQLETKGLIHGQPLC